MLGSLLRGLELSQQWKNFGTTVFQFVDSPPGNSIVGLMETSSKRTYANMLHPPGLLLPVFLSPRKACADSCLCRRPSNTHRQVWLSLLGVTAPFSGSWCTQGFFYALQVSLVGMRFDFKMWLCPFYHLLAAFPLPLDVWYHFLVGSNIFLSMVVQQLVAILVLLQKMSTLVHFYPL